MDRMKKRKQQEEMKEAKVDRTWLVMLFILIENKATPEQQLQTYNAIISECEAESSIIHSEIQRLQAQRTTLCNMIQYIEVCFMFQSLKHRIQRSRCRCL